jgi:protein-S-isoprenylcysteine O-methyltransferase Ste14
MKRVLRFLLITAVAALGIFALAGTWRDPWLWWYLGAWGFVGTLAMLYISDDLARERYRPASQGADRISLRVIRFIALVHLIIGILDGTRFHWSTVPDWLRAVGLVGFVLSFLLVVRAMAVNRFFSAVVRVQEERGHHVIDQGPYARVRHPGYAGMIPSMAFSALALGSWASLPIALLYSGLIVRRMLFEDRFLRANLEGYDAYARRVRYRLVPAVF